VWLFNGGGTISDLYQPSERAVIFGWCLLGPLLGVVILSNLECPWLFSVLVIICGVAIIGGFFLKRPTSLSCSYSGKKRRRNPRDGSTILMGKMTGP